MPRDLRKAREALDRHCRKAPFETDADRVGLIFRRYQELTAAPPATIATTTGGGTE